MGSLQDLPPLPTTQTAVITTAEGRHAVARDRAVPACGPTSVLVRVRAVALNPTDHKTPARVKTGGLTAGCDFAGEVVAVGARANDEPGDAAACAGIPRRWAPGDRVLGVVYGSNPGAPAWGAFAEYVEADPVMLCRLPDGWDWETAASVGGSVHGSVALCLFGEGKMGLDMGGKKDLQKVVLVYGGSTACGTMALQILRLAGYIPIATCSARNAGLVTAYGAAATFDYNLETCADEIKEYTKSALWYALDCIGTAQSAALCYAALGRAGGRYVALEKYPDSVAALRKVVKPTWVMGPVMFGRDLQLGEGYSQPADPSARAFARIWYPLAEALLGSGALKNHPVKVVAPEGREEWPEAVIRGLGGLRDGKVSAQKLTVTIAA
ncbi:alcohol dehydrogenase-like protein [Thermothelomyces thermophilus ATCC 42464]|uniref:Alcohol dehydrogenase-like protein n=1 Tax=Thermothelomyces thermophilus (strain ATCC 42464 / BCRC 31852 / DSM 1799) TaxID=573729 RepID=G2QDH9_THET4|nr:alcohol dehydrogenase-like protein [Thermothelomyces thermophilus ATCC 42464]AEO57491.1 alcohol dehydrogenase-like protein [Thermothelomyces thermophilus ATCC 42464]